MPTLEETKKGLDAVSPSLCLAKWNQVTIHLGTGLNHSCHHPGPHKINETEVMHDPRALHNTMYKKKCWKEMLEGRRPKECEYCWKIEDTSPLHSDRIFKSSEPWAWPTLDQIKDSDWLENYNPTYVEISFSNRCNYKCLYCSPQFSSAWNAEAKQYGPLNLPNSYYVLNGPIDSVSEERCKNIESNPLVKAFWEWWPELFKGLHTFRMTGGEPLLTEECYRCLEYIQEHWEENPDLVVGLNTNLGMSDSQFDRFLEIAKDLKNNRKVRELILFTSIESMGKEAEYIRFGLNTKKFWERVERMVSEIPTLTLTIMATYNILSIFSFDELIDRVYELKVKYHSYDREYGTALMLDTSYIRYPDIFSPKLANEEQREIIRKSGLKKEGLQTYSYKDQYGFIQWAPGYCSMEIEKIKRIYDYVQNDSEPYDVDLKKKQLKAFLEEEDRRRGTNYLNIWKDESSLVL